MKSVLVIGMGKFGKFLATKLQELDNDVMVVDKDEAT
ncbi:MAG TPA: NAD-binding protein, partial [Clostridia bacterium]|nr:NAD-binding protein [Clostridia bacterium]